ncbi:MAG TPA: hypothetical protein PLJ21_08525 [Pseudobdellovibrionaceae bacterium]|nr:hypothetical protein [Pseudobdellovibrionaceae bacterium]
MIKKTILIFFSIISLKCFSEPLILPAVTEVKGKSWIEISGKAQERLKPKTLIRENLSLETTEKSHLILSVKEKIFLRLNENSKIEVPAITWETLEFSYIDFKFGDIIWEAENVSSEKRVDLILKNELLYLTLPLQGKFQFIYKPELAQIEVRVYEGEIEFSQMNAEVSQKIKSGQKIKFQGLRGEDGIEYDLLLKGKKIPKGFLTPIEPMTTQDLKIFKDLYEKPQKKKTIVSKNLRSTGPLICDQPRGEFNQCRWVCEQNPKGEKKKCLIESGARCVRSRCNANGQWADAMVLEGGARLKCQARPLVEPCDY